MSEIRIPEKYEPIGPAQYFWLSVLFTIPVIGFIFLIVFSCSSANLNRRNFARSYFIPYIITFIIVIIALITGAGATFIEMLKDGMA